MQFLILSTLPQVSTVDKYQGQQNDYVLLSMVRTRVVGHIRDVRRLVSAATPVAPVHAANTQETDAAPDLTLFLSPFLALAFSYVLPRPSFSASQLILSPVFISPTGCGHVSCSSGPVHHWQAVPVCQLL